MIIDCGKSQGYIPSQRQTVTGCACDTPLPVAVIYWKPNQKGSFAEVMSRAEFADWLNEHEGYQSEVYYVQPKTFSSFNKALVRHRIRECDVVIH